jgi:eukaryotic-like serine/threonine-protein kinase
VMVSRYAARPGIFPDPIRSGTMLGRCRLDSVIGNGSMGVVWKAWHTTLDIPVAVKILHESHNAEERHRRRERFKLEAHIAAKASHPNLVRVLDFGEEHGQAYLVMELVKGETLQAWLQRRAAFDERTCLKLAGHICIGLAGLHHLGVVHRDIKPSNILIESGHAVKISDLGLARDANSALNAEPAGTPHFMAPECLDTDKALDPRSDLYAVGVILFQLIMGRVPFHGTTREVLYAQLNLQPDWCLPEGSSVDSGTLYILRRLLEKDPAKRIQTAIEAIQACREQVQRLDRRETLRAEKLARLAEMETREILETGKTSLAHKTWTSIDKFLPIASIPHWARWTGLFVLGAVCVYIASCAMR